MMTNDVKTPAEAAIQAFEEQKFEQTYCAVHDAFETFTLAIRNNLKVEIFRMLPEINDQPFKILNMVQLVIGFGAPREGARAIASLMPNRPIAAGTKQIDYDRLWHQISEINNPKSLVQKQLRQILESLPYMDDVLTFAGNSLHASLMEKVPILVPQAEAFRQMVFANLMYGVKIEFILPRLVKEVQEEEALMRRLLNMAALQKDFEKAPLERLKKNYGVTGEKLPWPTDMHCVCGADLLEQPRCCDSPENVAITAAELSPNYLLKTPCCGATLTGIRCEACARYFTWAIGTVPTYRD